jgi:hypothetical protein
VSRPKTVDDVVVTCRMGDRDLLDLLNCWPDDVPLPDTLRIEPPRTPGVDVIARRDGVAVAITIPHRYRGIEAIPFPALADHLAQGFRLRSCADPEPGIQSLGSSWRLAGWRSGGSTGSPS